MSELNLKEASQSSRPAQFLAALKKLRTGEVLTVFLGEEDDPDNLSAEVEREAGKWDFQKQRVGDGSWLLHAKLGR